MESQGFTTSVQQRRLLGGAEGLNGPIPIAACTVHLAGAVQLGALEQALGDVVHQHEVLRTAVRVGEGGDHEVELFESGGLKFAESEPGSLGEGIGSELDTSLERQGWGLHAQLLTLGPDEHQLYLRLPATSADTTSLTNLAQELATAYEARIQGRAHEGEAMQYIDIADWQAENMASDESAPGRAYWQEQVLSAGLAAELPFQGGGASKSGELAHHSETVAGDLARALLDSDGPPPSTRLLAALFSLIHRLSGSEDLVVGLRVAGREFDELRDAMGPLARTLPLGVKIDGTQPFGTFLEQVASVQEQAALWQDCFDAEALNLPSALPFSLEWQDAPQQFRAAGVEFSPLEILTHSEPLGCHLAVQEGDGGLCLTWHYDSARYSPSFIQRLHGQLTTLLEHALAAPSTAIDQLRVLSPSEWQELVVDLNDSAAEYPKGVCAHHWFEQFAASQPDAVAVRQGSQCLTYEELDHRANQLAHHLQARGVEADTLVALCIDRSLDMVVSILGILKAGGAYVPVDPTYPTDRIAFIVEDTAATVLVTQSRLASDFANSGAQLVCMDTDRAEISAHSTAPPTCPAGPGSLVYVIYTSGSTGKPKGVVITHEKLVISNNARMQAFGHCPESFLLLSSVAFDSSVVGIFWSLCGGGSLLLMPEGLEKEIASIGAYIAEHGASHLLTLPSFYRHILEQCQSDQLSGLRAAIVAGEACPLKLVQHHKRALPSVGLFSEYGATETTVFSSVYDCLDQTAPIAPLGAPIDNMQMYVLDPHLNPCPTGVPGEVHFGGPALAVEYLHREELTAERFVSNPFRAGANERLYKSGDLARFCENADLEFLGRLDNQVKIRGFRIELEEIEVALLRHAAIKEVAVLALADLSDEKRLVAYASFESGQSATVAELRDCLLQTLPEFMLPAVFVFLDDMPRTPNGKVDRKNLPAPGGDRPDLESSYEAPSSPLEEQLAGIWCEVLGLEQVGVNDNFFELGGDSILSIQVVSRANQAGLKITPRQVFENQTVAELVAVSAVDSEPALQEDQSSVEGSVCLTPVQHWYFELGLPDPQHWNMPILLDVRRGVDLDQLNLAFAAIVQHHDALRSRFVRGDDGWTQRIAAYEECQWVERKDLSDLKDEEQEVAFQKAAADLQRAFNLEQGPLLAALLIHRGKEQCDRLFWNVHHLVIDGVSWRVLLEDLELAIDQLERGEAVSLPPKTTSFQRWASCLHDYASSPELTAEAKYWQALAGHTPVDIPIDHPDGVNLESSSARVRTSLDPELTRSLLSEVPKAYNTQINDVLLTALSFAIGRWTSSSSCLLTLEGHGRQEIPAHVDLSRTVGWFTSDYSVLLKNIGQELDPGKALVSTKEQLASIPTQGFSFGLARYLSNNLELRETMASLPVPAIGFNYLGQFDQLFKEGARFGYCDEHAGPSLGPDGKRIFLLEVYGRVASGCLEFDFEYSHDLHDRNTIEQLAESFQSALEQVIQHCLSLDTAQVDGGGFGDFDWSADDLSNIMDAINDSQETDGGAA